MRPIITFISSVLILLTGCTKANPYLEDAKDIAVSEMAHHPQLWTCDGAPKPKWEYTPTLMARAFVEL